MLKALGVFFYLVGIADFAGMFFGYDFTGQFWTPILFGALGQLFFHIDEKRNAAKNAANDNSAGDQ